MRTFRDGTSRRGGAWRRIGLVAAVAGASAMLAAAPVGAETETGVPSGPWPPGLGTDGKVTYLAGEIPPQIVEQFKDCPRRADMPTGVGLIYCLRVRAYDGVLQLGSVQTTIDTPLELLVGIGYNGAERKAVIVMPEGAGDVGFEPVSVAGGITGIAALDPVVQLDPTGLLALSASPSIGDLTAGAEGDRPTNLTVIGLPLAIKLNNPLLGDNCVIGTPEDPIVINAVTDPAFGGSPPASSPMFQWLNYEDYGDNIPAHQYGIGARSVDHTFAVPGADCSGINGLGDSIESLLASVGAPPLNPFEAVINGVAGLPSPPGQNHVSISVDTSWITAPIVDIIDRELTPVLTMNPDPIEFGSVDLGGSATSTAALTNTGTDPLVLGDDVFVFFNDGNFTPSPHFQLVDSDCEGRTLAPGEHCDITVRFAPASAGVHLADVAMLTDHEFGYFESTIRGIGNDPDAPPPAPPAPPAEGPDCLLGLGIDLGILCL